MPLMLRRTHHAPAATAMATRAAGGGAGLVALLLAACGGGGGGGGTDPDRAQIQVTISGLPSGTSGSLTVTGPGGFQRTLTASGALTNLNPGTYAIAATGVENDTVRFAPTPLSQSVTVAAAESKAAAVGYAPATGRIAVGISGLPSGVGASVLVQRVGGAFAQTLAASATLSKLNPGSYTVTADTIEDGGTTYPGAPRTQSLSVVAGYTPAAAAVAYAPLAGTLRITVSGLPVAIPANITVTGPGGYNQAVTATTTLMPPESGTYTITAATATQGPDVFNPTPTAQQVAVNDGAQSQATVTYASASGETFNLSIGRFYLTQSVQRPNNGVALVAARPALVRVFVLANEANAVQPQVRVRFFQGVTQVREDLLPAPGASVPLAVNEASLASSWNVLLPAGFLQPGMSVEVLVDPANAVAESAESDNGSLPAGQTGVLGVTTTPSFNVTMVPITQAAKPGTPTGDVSAGNLSQWLDFTRRIHPLNQVDATIRAPYSTQTILTSGGGGWTTMLSEVQALKLAEGSTRYYYGVADVGYTSGVAGIGYLPSSGSDQVDRAALGWDHLPSGAEVAAHEWGHNFGRRHVNCGGPDPSSLDFSYPYPSTSIGQWGWDHVANALREPSVYRDVMSYCEPQWISDHMYEGVLDFRETVSYAVQGPTVEGVLIWGRIEDGQVVLEPAFAVIAPATPDRGEWIVEGLDEAGGRVSARRFSATPVADLPGEPRTFAFVLPLDEARRGRLAALRVSGPAGTAERRATPLPPGARVTPPDPTRERAGGRTRIRWDSSRFGAAMVRDAATGEVLAIVRSGGEAEVAAPRGDLEVTLSDGVRSARVRVR
jgi:hypothetical protein